MTGVFADGFATDLTGTVSAGTALTGTLALAVAFPEAFGTGFATGFTGTFTGTDFAFAEDFRDFAGATAFTGTGAVFAGTFLFLS